MLLGAFGEANRFRVAELLREGFYLGNERGADFGAGNEVLRVGVGDDVAEVIDDVNGAAAYAGILQTLENRLERDDSGEHTSEIVGSVLEGDGKYEGWTVGWGKG